MIIKASEANIPEIVEFLSAEAEVNTFILADIRHYWGSGIIDLRMQREAGRLRGVILRFHSDYLAYARLPDCDPAELADFVNAAGAELVHAHGDLAEALAPRLPAYRRHRMTLCRLSDGDRLAAGRQEIEIARPGEAGEIAAQFMKIRELAELYAEGAEKLAEMIRNRMLSGEGIHMIFRENGEIAAHGNIAALTEKSAFIGGIFTLPECRGRGYAAKITSALCAYLLERGITPVLSFDNPDAGRLYYKLGFEAFRRWEIMTRAR